MRPSPHGVKTIIWFSINLLSDVFPLWNICAKRG